MAGEKIPRPVLYYIKNTGRAGSYDFLTESYYKILIYVLV